MKKALSDALDHLRLLYLKDRFFVALGGAILLSVAGFWWTPFYYLALLSLLALLAGLAYDLFTLARAAPRIHGSRTPPKVLSLSDAATVRVRIQNAGKASFHAILTDELPPELQIRDHALSFELEAEANQELTYQIQPMNRGLYRFGDLNIFLSGVLGLAERRVNIPQAQEIPVYPSILQMRQFALQAKTTVPAPGRRRTQRLAKSYEFDQIKEYVRGDDYRSINWKATSRLRTLMVNQYEDERAQRIYCCIDKGRTMLMPFNGLTLLDYSINASLALSNVVLEREDRAGLLTFSDKIGTVLPADAKPGQIRRIMESLYRQEDRQKESNFELLYYAGRKLLGGRSLLILFTNFESNYALDRILPSLRRVAKMHPLVVVLFENTEIAEMLDEPTDDVEDVYRKSTARNFLQQRQLMAARLRQNGVRVVLTRPEDLTGDVINKYLELKSMGVV